MLRSLILAAAVGLGLALAACQPVSTGNPQVDAILNNAAAMAKQQCGIVVVAAQIVQLVPNPQIVSAASIANALCSAVLQANRKRGLFRTAGSTGTVQVNIGGNVVNVTVQR